MKVLKVRMQSNKCCFKKTREYYFIFQLVEAKLQCILKVMTKNLDATLMLAKEKLFEPAFTDEDFKRVKKQNIEGLESRKRMHNI